MLTGSLTLTVQYMEAGDIEPHFNIYLEKCLQALGKLFSPQPMKRGKPGLIL